MNLDTSEGMEATVVWTNRTMETLSVGGTWFVPRSSSVVTKTGFKTCTVTNCEDCIIKVLKAGGWAVKEVT